RDVLFVQLVADVAEGRWRNGEDGLVGIANVGIRASAITVVSGIVIVEQIVVSRIAIRTDGAVERMQIAHHRTNARRSCVRAVAVSSATVGGGAIGAAAIAIFGVPIIGASLRIGVFDFVDYSGVGAAGSDQLIVRGCGGVAVAVAEP